METVWIIGGSSVYEESLTSCDRIYLTEIEKEFDCDVHFPPLPEGFVEVNDEAVSDDVQVEGDITYRYKIYQRS